MTEAIDLGKYLVRTGVGDVRPDFPTLAQIQRAHPAAIPFENLSPWLGQDVTLDETRLQRKLISEHRGGYCFEHNLLLLAVLRQIGFTATPLGGRVLWNAPPGPLRPRTHMLLRVDLAGEHWLIDGGFGSNTVTAPLRMFSDVPQTTPHGRYRLQPLPQGERLLQAEVDGEWRDLYRFTQEPQVRADYEMASWYLCHHPESHFRQHLIVARSTEAGRFALRDTELNHRRPDGHAERRVLRSAADLRRALTDVFGLGLDGLPELDARLQALVDAAPV